MNFRQLQHEVEDWQLKNFPDHPSWHPLLGVVEEVGELSHSVLKQTQGIRGTFAEHELAIRDAVGDIIVFLCDFCTQRDIDLQDVVEATWYQVKQRNWRKSPTTGA